MGAVFSCILSQVPLGTIQPQHLGTHIGLPWPLPRRQHPPTCFIDGPDATANKPQAAEERKTSRKGVESTGISTALGQRSHNVIEADQKKQESTENNDMLYYREMNASEHDQSGTSDL